MTRTSKASGKAAIFDHASYGRGIPLTMNAYDRLVELTHGVPVTLASPPNNGGGDFYVVNCEELAGFPNLTYEFVGHDKEWMVTPEQYSEKLDESSCVLNVRALGSGDEL